MDLSKTKKELKETYKQILQKANRDLNENIRTAIFIALRRKLHLVYVEKLLDTKGNQSSIDRILGEGSDEIKAEKNRINGLSEEYYKQIIVINSMPHFHNIELFLKNPRNTEFSDLYHDSADEIKQKIIVKRSSFKNFDDVFSFLYEEISICNDTDNIVNYTDN